MRLSSLLTALAVATSIPAQALAFNFVATEIARQGEQMPGQSAGTNFLDLEYTSTRLEPAMAANGTVAFVAGNANEFRTGLYSGDGTADSIELATFAIGEPLRHIRTLAAGGGTVALSANDSATNTTGIRLLAASVANGPITTVAAEGTLVNGTPLPNNSVDDVGIDGFGNLAFGGGGGVYLKRFGQPIEVVRPNPGTAQVFFEGVNIGDTRVVYSEFAVNSAFQAVDNNRLWQTSGDTTQLSVDAFDILPGTTKTWAADHDSFPDPLRYAAAVVDGNQMFFYGRRGAPNFQTEYDGIYRATLRSKFSTASRDQVAVVARENEPIPTLPGRNYGTFLGHSADSGMGVFLASYYGSNSGTGLFGSVGSHIYPILTTGMTVPSDTGDQVVTAITRLGRDAIQGNSIAVVLRLGGSSLPAVYRIDLGAGTTQTSALIANSVIDEQYQFELDLGSSGAGIDFPIWLDPPATNGYDFATDGANFASVTLPTEFNLDELGEEAPFTINFGAFSEEAYGGETISFTDFISGGVDAFGIRGIGDSMFGSNATIAAGLTFVAPSTGDVGRFTVTQTAVPEPATVGMLVVAGLACYRRARKNCRRMSPHSSLSTPRTTLAE